MVEAIVICPSCEGYAWIEDDEGNAVDCDWCNGVGYVYRNEHSIDRRIPQVDYGKVADRLEKMEIQRMRKLGYSGDAKKPWEQAIRKRDEDEP